MASGVDQVGLRRYAKGVLSAYKREMAAKDAEIQRLKAALKPVMECELPAILHVEPNGDRLMCIGSTEYAVREAKRIMKEGDMK